MTAAMKKFLRDRGLTAVQVAGRAGILVPDIYRQLNGGMKPDPALRDTLCGIYGMTSKEYQEAIP